MTFSAAALPRDGAEDAFRDSVQNLRLHAIDDCFLTVFHVGDSYALLSGETIPGAHTATNSALSAYLTRCLIGDDVALDLEAKIDQLPTETESTGAKASLIPRFFPIYPFI
ncbi:hypothetical protein [Arthrobacter sp. D1-17]